MIVSIYIFWISILLIITGYLIYPVMLGIINLFIKKKPSTNDEYPSVSIIVACHNEEKNIKDRITNILACHYPKEKLEIIIASDGSTDQTVNEALKWQNWNIKALDLPRQGRASAHNEAVRQAENDILIFTDAETIYDHNCLKQLCQPYTDKHVGATSGVLVDYKLKDSTLGRSQGLYWKLEYFLRRTQSNLGVLSKTSGANMSIRRKLFKSIPLDVDIDQVAGPDSLSQGFKVVHAQEAIAYEEFATDLKRQLASRQRFTIQSFSAIKYHLFLLNILRHPILSFHFIFYRLWRYLTPFFLIAIFISNGFLIFSISIYLYFFVAQVGIYAFAILGYFLEKNHRHWPLISTIFSIIYLELGILLGVLKSLFGKKYTLYSKQQ